MIQRQITKLIIVGLLITIGILLEVAGLLDAKLLLGIAREFAQHWWLIVILVLAQTLLFTFALAGSLFLWIVAPLYTPLTATFILAAGATFGGLGAYRFSKYLTDEWKQKIEHSQTYKLLHAQDNFFTLFAMRVFPGFPHSIVNYSAGILNAKLSHFIAAAVVGISIKSYIYARIIHSATRSLSLDMLFDVSIYGPLILLSALSMVGVYINYQMTQKRN